MKGEVRFYGVLRRGGGERGHRRPDGLAARGVDARGRQRRRLALDADPEVDHVEDVVMCADRRGLDGERGGFGHREHERSTALEGFDEALAA